MCSSDLRNNHYHTATLERAHTHTHVPIPVVYGCTASPAAVDPEGEQPKEEEEAGHAEAHLVDGSIAHQHLAALACIHPAQLTQEGDLQGDQCAHITGYPTHTLTHMNMLPHTPITRHTHFNTYTHRGYK